MNKSKFLEEKIALLENVLISVCNYIDKPAFAEKYKKSIKALQEKFEDQNDGRKSAWTEERKAEFGKKIANKWSEKRELTAQLFYLYKVSDKPPTVFSTIESLATELETSKGVVKKLLKLGSVGFLFKIGHNFVAVVTDPKYLDAVLRSKFDETGNSDDIVRLQTSKAKRF